MCMLRSDMRRKEMGWGGGLLTGGRCRSNCSGWRGNHVIFQPGGCKNSGMNFTKLRIDVWYCGLLWFDIVENLEINNSLKWALFIQVSGQITSNTLWKRGEVFFLRIWRIFLFLRALVNIPVQTLIIPPWPLLRTMIVSQLELGPPVFRRGEFDGIW